MSRPAISRRAFAGLCGAAGAALLVPARAEDESPSGRAYHLSVSPAALKADPELLALASRAGVTHVWLTGFLYGHWLEPLHETLRWRTAIEKHGMSVHLINVPLGHPGDSLGAKSGNVPLTPPRHWRLAVRPDGTTYAGTSLHAPATEENCAALREIQAAGVTEVFLDDDFRLARGPGTIGGCFCPDHRREFLERTGYRQADWDTLIDSLSRRELTPVLRAWVEFTCDQLTASFRAQQKAAPGVRLGIMVMYLGSEKAGIRLNDYRDVRFRVGEFKFDDRSFGPVKGKTDELFSSLFHRGFVGPEHAFSETTAYPANQLSARNMAAKLAVSTLSDVRNTMFMSGMTAFPREHWVTLGPAMKRHAGLHSKIAGHAPRGPLKHFWGDASRMVGSDDPYSLFLAMGIPFETTSQPAGDGVVFLGDADARAMRRPPGPEPRLVARPQPGLPASVRPVPESLGTLFALKRDLLPGLDQVPYVEGEVPAVCAWYPTARAAVIWNLSDRHEELSLRFRASRRTVGVDGLGVALVEELAG